MDVTIQFIKCDDPIESAARRQRIMQNEEQGLMVMTAANIIAAVALEANVANYTIPEPTQDEVQALHHSPPLSLDVNRGRET